MSYRDSAEMRAEVFYVATSGRLLCLDQATGKILWQAPLDSYGTTILLVEGRKIFCAGGNRVTCVSDEGSVLWQTKIKLMAPVTVAYSDSAPGGRLIISGSGLLYGLTAETGEVIWKNGLEGLGYNPICLRVPGAVATAGGVTYRSGKHQRVFSSDQTEGD